MSGTRRAQVQRGINVDHHQGDRRSAPRPPPAPASPLPPRSVRAGGLSAENPPSACARADEIKSRIKSDLELPRYKIVVQVVIGEQRGEGVRMGCRCFWDPDADSYAEDTYRNDSLFCVAAAFGVYLY